MTGTYATHGRTEGDGASDLLWDVPQGDSVGIGEYRSEGAMWSPDGRYLAYRYSDCSDRSV